MNTSIEITTERIFFESESGSDRDKFHLGVGNSFLGKDMVGSLIPNNFVDLKWEKDRNSGIPEMETVILPLVPSLSNSQ